MTKLAEEDIMEILVHVRLNLLACMILGNLTFWRRIFFFQILAHPVFKM